MQEEMKILDEKALIKVLGKQKYFNEKEIEKARNKIKDYSYEDKQSLKIACQMIWNESSTTIDKLYVLTAGLISIVSLVISIYDNYNSSFINCLKFILLILALVTFVKTFINSIKLSGRADKCRNLYLALLLEEKKEKES